MMLVIKILIILFFLIMITAVVEIFFEDRVGKVFHDFMSIIMSLLMFAALISFVMYIMLEEVKTGMWF